MHAQTDDRVPARLRLWSLSEDVLVEVGPDRDRLVAFTQWGEIKLPDTTAVVCDSLQRMSLGPVSVENLPILGESYRHWKNGAGGEPYEPWYRFRQVLERLGCCVVQSLGLDDGMGPVLSVAPVSKQARFWLPTDVGPDTPIRLSRFVAMRTADAELVLESPVSQHRAVLHRPLAAWVVGSLGSTTTITELAGLLRIAQPVLADIVAYLVGSKMVLTGQPADPPRFAEEADPELIPWSHHDLQFHAYSRMGRHGQSGAVFPYLDRLPAAPVTKPVPAGPRFPLHRPAQDDLPADGPALTAVVEASRSYRDFSDRPVSAEQLGELLYRVARIRRTRLATGAGGATYATSSRPYPSTADLYELELYVTLHRCTGLPRGNYHYDPQEHTLTLIDDAEAGIAELLDTAKVAAGSTQRPSVLITMTTRIARLSWIYNGVAYSTTLKHVGALQQTLHLMATAMGLGSGAVEAGDGVAAGEVLRLDWPMEVSVGEFILGHRS